MSAENIRSENQEPSDLEVKNMLSAAHVWGKVTEELFKQGELDPNVVEESLEYADRICGVDILAQKHNLLPHKRIRNLEYAAIIYARANRRNNAIVCHERIDEVVANLPEESRTVGGKEYPDIEERLDRLFNPESYAPKKTKHTKDKIESYLEAVAFAADADVLSFGMSLTPVERSEQLMHANEVIKIDDIAREQNLFPHLRIKNLENASKIYAVLKHPFDAVDCHVRIEEVLMDMPELAQDYPRFNTRLDALWELKFGSNRLVDSMVTRRR